MELVQTSPQLSTWTVLTYAWTGKRSSLQQGQTTGFDPTTPSTQMRTYWTWSVPNDMSSHEDTEGTNYLARVTMNGVGFLSQRYAYIVVMTTWPCLLTIAQLTWCMITVKVGTLSECWLTSCLAIMLTLEYHFHAYPGLVPKLLGTSLRHCMTVEWLRTIIWWPRTIQPSDLNSV